VPAFCGPALVQALLLADLTPRVYGVGARLDPDETRLGDLLGPRVRGLVIAHVLGFPVEAPRWRSWCDSHGLVLVEDCSEAWLASCEGAPVGSFGDVAAFDLANTLPVPDSTMAVVRGRLLRERPVEGGGPAARSRARFNSALLGRLADPEVAERRHARYRALLASFEGRVPPPFAELPDGASPFAFPLEVGRPEEAAARLAAEGVEARPLLSHLSRVSADDSRGAVDSLEHVVALPVHQDLSPEDLDRIVDAASALLSNRSRPRRPELRLEPVAGLSALEDEWSELGVASGNLFATWEWQSTWWRHFGHGRRLLAAACRDAGGTLVGIVPVYLAARRPVRLVRFLGHGAGDRLGPICLPCDRQRVGRALRAAVRDKQWGSALVLGEQLPADESWSAVLGGRVLTREGNPVAKIENPSWDDFLAARSANLRQQVRRKERKLLREHELRYRLVEDRDDLAPALDTLFALHRARWEHGTDFAKAEAFHRDFAAQGLERGWLRLWLLEADGRPVAAWHGFRFAGADWYYQMGRDPDWERLSVGLVLLAHTIRDCVEAGLDEYRFLRGGEAYKDRFANADPGLETIALPSGQIGRAGVLAAETARRLRAVRR
jgi:CelD/BcsL family acetyltransferase involved in cellulose biosynthesis